MGHTYASRKRADAAAPKQEAAATQPSFDALRSGAVKPTAEQLGHRVDLPDVMRAKMENAFGADLSAVRLYESQAVADAGANAIAQGTNIAFAPGMLDFTSFGGQALLGHELSHVVSQARGEVTGGGFLNDRALEARADREGAMAAAGEQIAMPTAALSSVTAVPAAGPMQASKAQDKIDSARDAQAEAYDNAVMAGMDSRAGKKYMRQYNRALAKENRWAKKLEDNERAHLSPNKVTTGMNQLRRAKRRSLGADGNVDMEKYLADAQQIMSQMPMEQLMSDQEGDFRQAMINENVDYLKSIGSSNAFTPDVLNKGQGALAAMYGRMMGGSERLNGILSQSDNENVQMADVTKHADDSKVTPLLVAQFRRFYGNDTTPEQEHGFMHDFWNYGVNLNLGPFASDYQRGQNVLRSLSAHMNDNEDGTDPFTSTDQSPLANARDEGDELSFGVASAYANHLNPELVKHRLNDQIIKNGDSFSFESLYHFKMGDRDGVQTPYHIQANNRRTWLDASATYNPKRLEEFNEHDRLNGHRMTKSEIEDIDNTKMRSAIAGIMAVSNRFQSEYAGSTKDTWRNELAMESDAYNGGRLMEHLAAAANMGGDENTTVDDRKQLYMNYMNTMGSGDEAAQNELMKSLKGNYWQYLQRMKSQWGTDLENETAESLSKDDRYHKMSMSFGAESGLPLAFATQYSSLFDPENEEDQEFLQLARYFYAAKAGVDLKAQRGTGGVGTNTHTNTQHEFDHEALQSDSKAKLLELEARKRGRQG